MLIKYFFGNNFQHIVRNFKVEFFHGKISGKKQKFLLLQRKWGKWIFNQIQNEIFCNCEIVKCDGDAWLIILQREFSEESSFEEN
jgi:hypothetical protein